MMSNGSICPQPPGDCLRVRLSGSLVALAALATQLPGPLEVARELVGRGAAGRTGWPSADAALDGAALTVAAAGVWLMLGWASVICGLAAVARIPGGFGRWGRAILGSIAPAAIRRVLIAGVGVSVVAGAAACAVQEPLGGPSRPTAPAASPAATAAPTPTNPCPAMYPTADSITGGGARSGTAVRGVPSPAGAAESPDPDWPVQRPGSGPDVDVDWPDPPVSAPSRADPLAVTPHSGEPAPGGSHTATAHSPTSTPRPSQFGPTRRSSTAHPDAARRPAPQSAAPQSGAAQTGAPQTGAAQAGAAQSSAPHSGSPRVVIVHRGDSLWKLAARDLGPGADDAHVDAAWRRWYAANREVIGGDPNLIEPGQRLQSPTTSRHPPEN